MTTLRKTALALALLVTLLLPSTPVAVQSALKKPAALKGSYVDGELLVKFKKSGTGKTLHKSVGSTLKSSIKMLKIDHVAIPQGMTVQQAIALYRANPEVEFAEPNYRVRKAVIPDDPLYMAGQWNLPLIAAPAAWSRATGGNTTESVIVAVLDTGVAYTHPDLIANLWTNPGETANNGIDDDGNGIVDDYYGASFGGMKPGDPWDDDTADSHGSHVAGIIGAVGNNGIGIAGINWSARILAVKVLHGPEGYGELSDVLKGAEYALSKGAKILNCSIESTDDAPDSNGIQSLHEMVKAADRAGALVVSAAGNTGLNLDVSNIYPASIREPNNIAVAAVERGDRLASYSDYGRHSVDLAAPGGSAGGTGNDGGVLSTVWLAGGAQLYRTTSGTSMAAPHVSGAAALAWNADKDLTNYQVKARIYNSVDRLTQYSDKTITGGRLNLDSLLTVSDLPAVFNVSPYRLQSGTEITITGSNFGAATGSVTVGGKFAVIRSWSDISIAAIAPGGVDGDLLIVNGSGSGFPLLYPPLPVITITANPETGTLPDSTVFLVTVDPQETKITKYEWDFGTGIYTQSAGDSISHEFTLAGEYPIRARVTDDLGRVVEASLLYTVNDVAVPGRSGCFIATAAYGSYLHPKVRLLRDFRDNWLLTNSPGRAFVSLYYRYSPPLADFIAAREWLKLSVRLLLLPLIIIIENPAAISLLLTLFAGGAFMRWRSLNPGRFSRYFSP